MNTYRSSLSQTTEGAFDINLPPLHRYTTTPLSNRFDLIMCLVLIVIAVIFQHSQSLQLSKLHMFPHSTDMHQAASYPACRSTPLSAYQLWGLVNILRRYVGRIFRLLLISRHEFYFLDVRMIVGQLNLILFVLLGMTVCCLIFLRIFYVKLSAFVGVFLLLFSAVSIPGQTRCIPLPVAILCDIHRVSFLSVSSWVVVVLFSALWMPRCLSASVSDLAIICRYAAYGICTTQSSSCTFSIKLVTMSLDDKFDIHLSFRMTLSTPNIMQHAIMMSDLLHRF